ncbi:MAG: HYR domain-containing protein [Pseudomonadota bacterium]|nr:HYR domain-containing protein [Pseudomonadota bacterium]
MQIFLREIDSELPKVLKMDLGGERTEDALLLIGELLDEGKITLEALSFLDVTGLYDLVDAFIRPTCETLPPGAFVVQPIQIGDQPTHGFGLLAGLQSRSAPETAPGAQPTPEPVADTSAPEIVPVADPEVECASPEGTVVALGAPSVMDDSGQAGVGVVAPERYPLGATTVTWKAIDAAGNQASATNLVTVVDTTPPMIVAAAAEVSAECTSAAGTPVTLATTGSDACDGQVELTSDAPEAFPPGKTTVTWTAVDDAGNRSSGSQTVAVLDTAPPEITVADLTTECTSAAGAAVALEAEVSDQCDAEIELDSDAPERFPLGATTVRWEARDDADNQASAIQTVTVIDTTPPVIRVADLSVECLLVDGTPADLGASVSDLCESEVGLESDAPLRFPLGATQVTWRAQDAAGNLATATQTVTVADTTPPRITCPDDLVVEPTGPEGASISFAATGSDACSRATERECSPPSGGSFAIASETPVSCRATDAAGLESDCSFTVKVLSVKEVVSSLSSRLTGLRDSDRITADQAERRLTKAAARIERLIDQGKTRKACNQLEKAVVERVRTLVAKAMLPFEQGEAIIASADNVRAALECSQLRTRERRGE